MTGYLAGRCSRALALLGAIVFTSTLTTAVAHAVPDAGAAKPVSIEVQGAGFKAKTPRLAPRAASCTDTRFQACSLNAGARIFYTYPDNVPAILGIPITITTTTSVNRNDVTRTIKVGPAELESSVPPPPGTVVRLDFSDIGFNESVTLAGEPGAQLDEQSYTYNPGVGSGVATFALTIEGEVTYPDRKAAIDRDTVNSSTVRCDNQAYGSTVGCVNPNVEVQFTDMQRLPHIRDYIKRKIANFGSPTRLRRLADRAAQDRNRRAVCGRNVVGPPPIEHPTWECDEYPFASTYEGGQNGGVYGNTEFVPREEQRQQSAALTNNLPRNNRVLDGEYYTVIV